MAKSTESQHRKYVLVNDRGVGCAVLVNHRHHERDELWPEVQVLYGRTLLLSGKLLLPALRRRRFTLSTYTVNIQIKEKARRGCLLTVAFVRTVRF